MDHSDFKSNTKPAASAGAETRFKLEVFSAESHKIKQEYSVWRLV